MKNIGNGALNKNNTDGLLLDSITTKLGYSEMIIKLTQLV